MSLKKKTPRSGSRSGLGFIHTWPKPGPRPNLFKGKIPKYPHLYIHISFFLKKKKKKHPTSLIPFHSATNPLTLTSLSSPTPLLSLPLILLTSFCSPQPLISVTTGHYVHLRSGCFLSFSQSELTRSHTHTLTHFQAVPPKISTSHHHSKNSPPPVQALTHSQSHYRPKLSPLICSLLLFNFFFFLI